MDENRDAMSCLPDPAVHTHRVRVSFLDLSGNPETKVTVVFDNDAREAPVKAIAE